MDNNHQKSEPESEILMMMQRMGRTPQFCETLCDFTDLPGSSNGSKLGGGGYPPCFMENSQTGQGSSSFVKVESTVSSMNTGPGKEEQHLHCSITRRWREDNPTTPVEKPVNTVEAMREMIFRIAVMQPIEVDPEAVKPRRRRNVKISKDPQSVAARHRREKISERMRILQRLVPGGTKMDTASMLDEAAHYVKFLKTQVQSLERAAGSSADGIGYPTGTVSSSDNETNSTHHQLLENSNPS